jgi:hypothetical protein
MNLQLGDRYRCGILKALVLLCQQELAYVVDAIRTRSRMCILLSAIAIGISPQFPFLTQIG